MATNMEINRHGVSNNDLLRLYEGKDSQKSSVTHGNLSSLCPFKIGNALYRWLMTGNSVLYNVRVQPSKPNSYHGERNQSGV